MSADTKKKYNLKKRIINILKDCQIPISAKDIEDKLQHEFNKTSIYRQLEKLSTDQTIRKIETTRATLFEIYNNQHAHFQCLNCSEVSCLELPQNFKLDYSSFQDLEIVDTSVDLKGICKNCQAERV
jgi:Fe2+ or Zn2+ uptake regulation protein